MSMVKIEERPENKWGSFSIVKHFYCPNCNIEFPWEVTTKKIKVNYCYNCGEKIEFQE